MGSSTEAAYAAEPSAQPELLAQAAQLLYRATDLECADVRELVGVGLSCT